MTTRTVTGLFQELANKFNAAPLVEKNEQFWDTFDRAHSRITIELCQGDWYTFYRQFAGIGEPHVKAHDNRDSARQWARNFLAVRL